MKGPFVTSHQFGLGAVQGFHPMTQFGQVNDVLKVHDSIIVKLELTHLCPIYRILQHKRCHHSHFPVAPTSPR